MSQTTPYEQLHYLGEFASDSAVNTQIQTDKWDTSGDGTGFPQNGMLYFNTTEFHLRVFNDQGSIGGGGWEPLTTAYDPQRGFHPLIDPGGNGDYLTIAEALSDAVRSRGAVFCLKGGVNHDVSTTIDIRGTAFIAVGEGRPVVRCQNGGKLQIGGTKFEGTKFLVSSGVTPNWLLDVVEGGNDLIGCDFAPDTGKSIFGCTAPAAFVSTFFRYCGQSDQNGTMVDAASSFTSPFWICVGTNFAGVLQFAQESPYMDDSARVDCTSGTLTGIPEGVLYVAPGESIQVALDSVGQAGGGTVMLLPGTHDVTTDVFINYDDTHLSSLDGATIRALNSTWVGGTTTADAVVQLGAADGTSPVNNCNVNAVNVSVEPNIHGIKVNGGDDNHVERCEAISTALKSSLRVGILFTDSTTAESSRFLCLNNLVSSTDGTDAWVDGVHLDGNNTLGTYGYGNGIFDSIVFGNVIRYNLETSYVFVDCSASSIFNNRARDVGYNNGGIGLALIGGTGNSIVANSVVECQSPTPNNNEGLYIRDTTGNTITNNTVDGGTQGFNSCITLLADADQNIVKNNILNNATVGIANASGCDENEISPNIFQSGLTTWITDADTSTRYGAASIVNAGSPDGAVNGVFGQKCRDTTNNDWYLNADYPVGTTWERLQLQPAQVVTVAKSGGDFTTIAAAIASITDASVNKPYEIVVYAGVYAEAPLTLKQYVILQSHSSGAAFIAATDNNNPLVTPVANTGLDGFAFIGPTNDAAVYVAGGVNNVQLNACNFVSGQTAIHCTGSGSGLLAEECKTFPGVTNGLLAENSGRIDCSNVLQHATNAFYADGGTIWVHNSGGQNNTNGLYADDGGIIYPHNVTQENCTNAVRIGSTGSGSTIEGNAVTCRGSTAYDLLVESASAVLSVTGIFRDEYISVEPGATFNATYFDPESTVEDGQTIAGALSIGLPESANDMNAGEGAPYTRDMVVITTDSTATSTTDGGNLTDVSEDAASPSGSTFTFQGTGANHTILIGTERADASDVLKTASLRFFQTTAAVEATTKSFALEYWDGAAWAELPVMATSVEDLYRYANELFIRANSNEDIFYPLQDDWTKKTISSKNLYWLRVRVTNALTTAPVFEQLQLGTSRLRTTGRGLLAMYGLARYKDSLLSGGNIFGESGGVTSGSLAVGSGGLPTGWNHAVKNSIFNGNGDAIYFQSRIPKGACTSCSLQVSVTFSVTTSGASTDGSVIMSVLPVEIAGVLEADPTGGLTPVARTVANTETLTAKAAQTTTVSAQFDTSNKIISITSDDIDISDYYEGDMLLIRVELDDDGTGNKDMLVWTAEIEGVKWTLGERLPNG